mgnify:CR=1 FL=1
MNNTISIKHSIDEAVKKLDKIHLRQVPFAERQTLNELGQGTKREIDKQILRRIDRPRAYTKRSMRVDFAKKNKPVTRVKVKDTATVTKRGFRGPDQIIGHLFTGGTRKLKGMEILLRKRGILPQNRYIVIGEGAPQDRHGNIKAGMNIKILSFLQAFKESGFRANADANGRKRIGRSLNKVARNGSFFVVKKRKIGGLHPGIWARIRFASGTALKPMLMFVRKPTYRRIIDIPKTANNHIRKNLNEVFNRQLRKAIATSR